MLESISHNYLALGMLIGATLTKIFGIFFKYNFSESAEIRKELREEIRRLNGEIIKLNEKLDEWKLKFYQLAEENMRLKTGAKDIEIILS